MKASIRLKLDMATRLRDLARTLLDGTNPGFVAAFNKLVELLARAEALAQQAITGQRGVTGAIAARLQLREEIADSLALLGGLTGRAAAEEPALEAGISRPDRSASTASFLTRGRVATATALAHRELFERLGMPPGYPEDLGRMLDEFEAAVNQKHAGQAAHIGAHAELRAVTAEIMGVVQQLDAIARFSFRNDAEALSAWRSARNVAWKNGDRGERIGPAAEQAKDRPAA